MALLWEASYSNSFRRLRCPLQNKKHARSRASTATCPAGVLADAQSSCGRSHRQIDPRSRAKAKHALPPLQQIDQPPRRGVVKTAMHFDLAVLINLQNCNANRQNRLGPCRATGNYQRTTIVSLSKYYSCYYWKWFR